MEYRDYYDILGVDRSASKDEIKRAYRRLARKYHPDVSEETDAEERFKEIGEAYEVLGNEENRGAYDQLGDNWRNGQSFQPPPDWEGEFSQPGGGFSFGNEPLSDFFESLFGRNRFDNAPSDQHATIEVTLEQLFRRDPIELTLQDVAPGKGGQLQRHSKRLKVTIPPGLREGETFRLKGQGSGAEGTSGDLYLKLKLRPHDTYTVKNLDVHSEVTISPWEAVLGAEIPVRTLGGEVNLKIPAGSKSGSRLRLKDRGLPHGGHHYVTLNIDVPTAITEEERRLYEQLASVSSSRPERQAND